jgi:pimeloyl-ACP methyl ester carboxylesterase
MVWVLSVAAAAVTYQYGLYVAREGYWHARRGWALANGQLVDIGGYRLYVSCRGAGTPVVVMDAGLESSGKTWSAVVPRIARFTRVCVYDRHGVGLSDGLPSGTTNRTAKDVVNDLHRLLATYQVPAPYVLVGHSVGGLHVRLYAVRHPEQVAGIVLVDSSHEDQYERNARSLSGKDRERYLRHESGGNFERLNLIETGREVRRARALPVVPLLVLSAAPTDFDASLQTDLARLRPDATHVVVPHSGHHIQNDAPAVVVESLRKLLPWSSSTQMRQ